MAGGKLTPRQKMINLMYLVFIAMLALNMSKEVLSAFGLMNIKFAEINTAQTDQNNKLATLLGSKAGESPGFVDAYNKSKEIVKTSTDFYEYIEQVKNSDILVDFKPENGILPYESMDKSNIDEKWFKGDGYSKRGQEIVSKIEGYRNSMRSILGKDVKYQPVLLKVEKLFNTDKVKDSEGVNKLYLDYHYKGFPAIASVAKLTAMQNDIKSLENECYNIFLGASYKEAASMKNFQAIVVLDKNAYFQGEQITGKVVLGRYDKNTVPTSFQGPGKIENGQAVISMTAGNVGEHKLGGTFTFTEDGESVPLKFEGTYVVVPKPNSANISADKMNVVYRGLDNPMTISFAGVPDTDVTASAAGLSKVGNGKYVMRPGAGREIIINVTAKLSDGKTVSDKKMFRIKGIPGPTGTIRGESGTVNGPKQSLEVTSVGAILEDFDFEVKLNVVGFNLKVPGQPTVVVSGNKMDARAKAAIAKAQRGDVVIVSEIKTKLEGAGGYMLPKTAPVAYEIK